MDGCTTSGTKMVGDLGAGVAGANEHTGTAANLNAVRGEARLGSKNAARSPLTRKAMAHSDANWIARRLHGELATATGSCASERCHGSVLSRGRCITACSFARNSAACVHHAFGRFITGVR